MTLRREEKRLAKQKNRQAFIAARQRERAARRVRNRHQERTPIIWLDPPVPIVPRAGVMVAGIAQDCDPEVARIYGVRFPGR